MPSLSEAVAASAMVAGVLKLLPVTGLVSDTAGGVLPTLHAVPFTDTLSNVAVTLDAVE
jgi:hypothetical protein